MSKQINDLQPQIERLQELAGEDFSQTPPSEKEKFEFAVTAADVNSKVQRLVQQGYSIGSEVTDDKNQPTSLQIKTEEQFNSLQARMNDVNEMLPAKKTN